MYLKHALIHKFRNFKDTRVDFNSSDESHSFALASPNGGGKSTLLQIIFILLHCYRNPSKHKFISQILENEVIEKEYDLVEFELNIDDVDYSLHFKIIEDNNDFDFSVYTNREIVALELNELPKNNQDVLREIIEIKDLVSKTRRLDSFTARRILQSFQKIDLSASIHNKLSNAIDSRDLDEAITILDSLLAHHQSITHRFLSLSKELKFIDSEIISLESRLKSNNLEYVLSLWDGYSLVVESSIPNEVADKIESHIFLSAPSSQVFTFLNATEREQILTLNRQDGHMQKDFYTQSVESAKEELSGFFTFDFTTTELISSSFEKAFLEDKASKIHNGEYGNNYDKVVTELNNFLEGKSISQDVLTGDITFQIAETKKQLKPEDLSHGELKKLSLYSWIKHIVPQASVVLIDELDIALHPKWQESILQDLGDWQPTNQYVIATHSPQVLNSIHYKNLRFLVRENGNTKIQVKDKAPLDRDTNSMIEAMGSNKIPSRLFDLHDRYRQLVEIGQHNSLEGLETRGKILEFESKDSFFLQDIQYDIDDQE
ncbi:putative ATPase_AAA_core domain-containing protein [Vibrio chagasii]|nr:putative ATPase_AAA_core domain-containing protein [Vibrio chagasii]CAH6813712.1 putative ATPase_AAA_core domain-containing protein [Vibrio chagasii]CAH6883285.1 putative ATPase_AAA_core domain-containing protein [Vibrio chagasii]CAH6899992.1 putative ATPase_AAA_core domain-containing protein [Vibrio chagasii]CAH6932897.1 putative ATPase_AAA_core domain-containing protein [Vibrio chagasii]